MQAQYRIKKFKFLSMFTVLIALNCVTKHQKIDTMYFLDICSVPQR